MNTTLTEAQHQTLDNVADMDREAIVVGYDDRPSVGFSPIVASASLPGALYAIRPDGMLDQIR